MKKLFIFALLLALAAGALGFWYWQKNIYSKSILKVEILGPSEVQIMDEVEYNVKYKNNGDITLENAKLVFEYPSQAIVEGNKMMRQERELEDIYPGEEKVLTFKARLLGKENDILQAKAAVYFKPKNLKASYESNTVLATKISFVPFNFDFDMPSKTEANKDFNFSLNYFSNLNYPISGLRAKIEYPPGFIFSSSNPIGIEKNEWEIPILNKAEGGRVNIKGNLGGETNDQKIFKATLGVWREDNFILLKEANKGVTISTSQMEVFQLINGAPNYVANPGDNLHYEIFFRNLGADSFQDLFLVAKLKSPAFDFDSVKTDGQFNKAENSIVWDWRTVTGLKMLEGGQQGKVEFWLNLKKDWSVGGTLGKNPALYNDIMISQTRQQFETKVNSKLAINQRGLYNDDYFGNTGSNSPKQGETTTYTIVWEAKNYYNNVSNVKVKAVLPQDAKLTGKIFPADSKLTFDNVSREVIWVLGDMEVGKGVLNPPPAVAFQLTYVPSQNGPNFPIIGQAKITGEDQFTSQKIESSSSAIDASQVK